MVRFWTNIFFIILAVKGFSQLTGVRPVFQTGHHTRINKLKFHTDNRHLISTSDDGKLIVWDVLLGLQRHSVIAHDSGLNDFEIMGDSAIVTVGNNGELKIWRFPDLDLIHDQVLTAKDINAVTVISGSVIGLVTDQLFLYNILHQELSAVPYVSKGLFTSIDYNHSRKEVALAGPGDNIVVSLSLTDKPKVTKVLLGSAYKAKWVGADYLFQANTNGTLRYFDYKKEKRYTFTLADDVDYVADVAWRKNEIAVCTALGNVLVINAQNHNVNHRLRVRGFGQTSIDYSENTDWLATGDVNGNIYLYSTLNYRLINILKSASAGITDLKVKENLMFVGYSNGVIRQVNLFNNRIKSNSVKLDFIEERDGVNYAITSIDSITDETVFFTTAKIDRHHVQTSKLSKLSKLKCQWKLNENLIVISKKVKSPEWKQYMDGLFNSNRKFRLEDLMKRKYKQKDRDKTFQFMPGKNWFYSISGSDSIPFETLHEAPISGMELIKNKQLVVTYSKDGSIRFWSYEGKFLATLYMSGQYDFVYFDAYNFYYASKEILSRIAFLFRGELFSYEQYDLFFNRPDLVAQQLTFLTDDEVSLFRKAYFKRLEKLGIKANTLKVSSNIPQLKVGYSGEYTTENSLASFELNGLDTLKKIVSYAYIINGAEKQFSIEKPNYLLNRSVNIELSKGVNQIEFYCKNTEGIKSVIRKEIINCEKQFQKSDLFLVSLGVSQYNEERYNLKYATKDALELEKLFKKGGKFGNVRTVTYTDREVLANRLVEIDTFLQQAKTNDIIIVFYAGHGVLDSDLDYYLGTYDLNFSAPEKRGIKFDELEQLVERQNCRNKLILLDACYSGEIDKNAFDIELNDMENMDSIRFRGAGIKINPKKGTSLGVFELSKLLFIDMRPDQGTNIISSASGAELAYEGEEWENGLFTYVLKNGLDNFEADLNGDKLIKISELQLYLRDEVSNLSKGNQNPLSRKENIKNNFVIW